MTMIVAKVAWSTALTCRHAGQRDLMAGPAPILWGFTMPLSRPSPAPLACTARSGVSNPKYEHPDCHSFDYRRLPPMRFAVLVLSLLGLALAGCSSSSGGGSSRPSKTYIIMPNGQVGGCIESNGGAC
jgi:hypothetical protein